MIQDLKQQILSNQGSAADVLAKALPIMRGNLSDEKLIWLANELQGYSNVVAFYQNKPHDFPDYRVVSGKLKMMNSSGQLSDVNHPLAQRMSYFLGAPLSWLEASASMPGVNTFVEMPELTKYIGAMGGNIICECTVVQLKTLMEAFKKQFIVLLDEVGAVLPK